MRQLIRTAAGRPLRRQLPPQAPPPLQEDRQAPVGRAPKAFTRVKRRSGAHYTGLTALGL